MRARGGHGGCPVPMGAPATEAASHGGSCSVWLCWVRLQAPARWAAVASNTSVPGPLPGVSADSPREAAEQLASGGLCLRLSYRVVRSPHVPRQDRASESGTDQEGTLEGHRTGGEARAGAEQDLPHPSACGSPSARNPCTRACGCIWRQGLCTGEYGEMRSPGWPQCNRTGVLIRRKIRTQLCTEGRPHEDTAYLPGRVVPEEDSQEAPLSPSPASRQGGWRGNTGLLLRLPGPRWFARWPWDTGTTVAPPSPSLSLTLTWGQLLQA